MVVSPAAAEALQETPLEVRGLVELLFLELGHSACRDVSRIVWGRFAPAVALCRMPWPTGAVRF
jgi:hypothetical protein